MINVNGRRFFIFRDFPMRDEHSRSRGLTAEGHNNADGKPVLEIIGSEKPRDGWPGVNEMEVFTDENGIAKCDPGITAHEIKYDADGVRFQIAALAGGVINVRDADKSMMYIEHDNGTLFQTPEDSRVHFADFGTARSMACGLATARNEYEAGQFAAGVIQWGGAGGLDSSGLVV